MAPTRSLHVAGEKLYVNTIKHPRSERDPAKVQLGGQRAAYYWRWSLIWR